MWRDVTHFRTLPANGEVLTPKRILMVGSSTTMRGSASAFPGIASVSPIWTSSMPAMAMMSPAAALVTFTRFSPS